MWFLHVIVDGPEAPLNENPQGFLGVDMGIVNIAADSDKKLYAGNTLNGYRQRQIRLRKRLQKKGTKSAKRLLVKRRRKEGRHTANVNHIISKSIVAEAERTLRGIAIEDLTGIRKRARLRKPQRVTLNSWAFRQLGEFLVYKAKRAGVPLVMVNPAYTSQTCSWCGHVDKQNRVDQANFTCRSCGVVAHADYNAARNIAQRGVAGWAVLMRAKRGATLAAS